jgi:hypothetical protein
MELFAASTTARRHAFTIVHLLITSWTLKHTFRIFLHDLHSRQVQAAITFEQFYRPCGCLKIEGAMHAAEADEQNFDNLVSFTEKKGCLYTQPQK